MHSKLSVKKTSWQYGLVLGLILIVFSLILSLFDLDLETEDFYAKLNYLFLAVILILSYLKFKKINAGFLTYKQGLKLGTLLSLIAGSINAVYTYFYLKFLDNSLILKIREAELAKLEEQDMSDEKIEQMGKIMDLVLGPFFISFIYILSLVFIGFIFSLILSAIFQKKPIESDPFDV